MPRLNTPEYFTQDEAFDLRGKNVYVKVGFRHSDFEVPQGSLGKVVAIQNDGLGWLVVAEIEFQRQLQFQKNKHRLLINNRIFRLALRVASAGSG